MSPATQTTSLLLEGLHDEANQAVWTEFDQRYRGIIEAFARRLGLSDADAADAAQETLLRFVREYRAGKYDRSRGRLRSWIIGIARHSIGDLRRRGGRPGGRGSSAIAELPDDERLSAIWDAECRDVLLRRALDALRTESRIEPRTLRAFELVAFEQQPPAAVAESLGMTASDVYVAKHRVLERLREVAADLQQAWELDPE